MKIQIWVSDSKLDDLGVGDVDNRLVDLYVRKDDIQSFWIDPEIDDDTGTRNINIYIGNNSFSAPYKKELAEQLYEIVG